MRCPQSSQLDGLCVQGRADLEREVLENVSTDKQKDMVIQGKREDGSAEEQRQARGRCQARSAECIDQDGAGRAQGEGSPVNAHTEEHPR